MIKKNALFGILIVLLTIACTKSKQSTTTYKYEQGESSVELKILNGKDYLLYDIPTEVTFEWTNIDPESGVFYGMGIKKLETIDGITKTEITASKKHLKKDTLNIQLAFKIKGEQIRTEFNVPVK